jgi:hypothetical protein
MQIIRHTLIFTCVAAFCFGSRAADEPKKDDTPKPAKQQLKPERLVSDNSVLYISTPDLKKARTAFERSAFRALLREDEVAQPLIASYGRMRDAYVRGDGTRTETEMRRRGDEVDLLTRIAPLLDGQVAISIEGDAASVNMIAEGVLPKFLIVASLPGGDEGEKRQRDLEAILEKHRSGQAVDPRFKDEDDRIGNYDIVRIKNPDLKLVEGWAFVENLFIYGQGARTVEDAIDRFMKNSAGTLARHTGYQSAYDQVGRDDKGDAAVYVQANMQPLLNLLSPALKNVLDPKLGALEANRPHFALGVHIGDGDNAPIRERIFVRLSKDGMPKKSGACNAITARLAQGDTVVFAAQQGSLAEIYTEFVSALKREQPAGADGKDLPIQEKLKAAFGVANAAEIAAKLELFKGEMAVFLSYVPQPNLKMDSFLDVLSMFQPVFAIELDPDNATADTQLTKLLTSIQAATGQEYIQTSSGATQIFYQKGSAPREEKTSPLANGLFENLYRTDAEAAAKTPFFAAHARVDIDLDAGKQRKFLLVSDQLNALKKAAQQAQPQYLRSSLSEDKRLKDLSKLFRESRVSIGYVDLAKMLDVYSSELPKLSKSGLIGRDVIDQFPSANALRDHMFPMAWASSVLNDPEGMLVECSSPMGNLPMIGVLGSVAWPAIVAQRQQAISDEVDDKFKHAMLALHLYAADFDRFPPQLSDLFNYVKKDLKVFESPFKRGGIKSVQDIDNAELTNMVYIPSRSLQDLGSDILMYEKDPTKLIKTRDGYKLFHHVLTLDGKKGWMPKSSLERTLAGKIDVPNTNVVETPTKEKKP